MPHRPWHRSSAPPGEKGGGGYIAPSEPKPFVDKRVDKSVSTSDVATGKFTGGTQRATPKPEVDKTFTKKVLPETKKIIPEDTGREKGIKKYVTTGLKELSEKRKQNVISILSNPNTTQDQKRKLIKKRNLSGALEGLSKRKQTAPVGLGIPVGGRDFTGFKLPEKSYLDKTFGWGGKGLTFFSPLHKKMDIDSRIEINKAFSVPPSLGFKLQDWEINKAPKVDAMRHLMWSAINPGFATMHDLSGGDTQDLHNNALRNKVLDRALLMPGGKTYNNIKRAALEMVMEQENRIKNELPPSIDLPITDSTGHGDQASQLYPKGQPYWSKVLSPMTSALTGHSLVTKADTPFNNLVNKVSDTLMNWRK